MCTCCFLLVLFLLILVLGVVVAAIVVVVVIVVVAVAVVVLLPLMQIPINQPISTGAHSHPPAFRYHQWLGYQLVMKTGYWLLKRSVNHSSSPTQYQLITNLSH